MTPNDPKSPKFAQSPEAPSGRRGGRTNKPENGSKKGSRNEYHRKRRQDLHTKALISVAKAWGKPVMCFQCEKRNGVLELDHLVYVEESVLRGHSGERAEEAIANPRRFVIHCRACHVDLDLKKLAREGLHPNANIGSEVRAAEAHRNRVGPIRRSYEHEVTRKEKVILDSQNKNLILEAELERAIDQLADERKARFKAEQEASEALSLMEEWETRMEQADEARMLEGEG